MGRGTWALMKQSKQFYILSYRRIGNALVVSAILNLFLGLAIYYNYFKRPEHAFYATNGVTYPDPLVPMDSPNKSSVALLAADPGVSDNNSATVTPQ